MPKKRWSCPNCGSELCSAIRFWKQKQTDFIDLYMCHDCGQATDPATGNELPTNWEPPRKLVPAQLNLLGEVPNVRSTVSPVPKMVEHPSGLQVGVYRAPEGSTEQYKRELRKMMLEVNNKHSGRENPFWYKYRRIKRGNNGRSTKT